MHIHLKATQIFAFQRKTNHKGLRSLLISVYRAGCQPRLETNITKARLPGIYYGLVTSFFLSIAIAIFHQVWLIVPENLSASASEEGL